jgi:hypothetical protein
MGFLITMIGGLFGVTIPPIVVQLLPVLLELAGNKQVQEAGAASLIDLQKLVEAAKPQLAQLGTQLFPGIDPHKAAHAAAQVVFETGWIKDAQTLLNVVANGGLTVDGVCGPSTRNVTRAFQISQQPKAGDVDGWPGPRTVKRLVELFQEAHRGMAGPVDGVLGSKTRAVLDKVSPVRTGGKT